MDPTRKLLSPYSAIIKADYKTNLFIKYNYVRNPYKLYLYLVANYPNWTYCNLFCRKTGLQVGNFTVKNPPSRSYFPRC